MKVNTCTVPVFIVLLVLSFSIACQPIAAVNTDDSQFQIPTPDSQAEPYKFEIGSLSVVPQEAKAGTTVIVSLPVRNTGSAKNAFIATLYVDGHEYGTEDVTLQPGNSGSVTFLFSGLDPGDHQIAVAGIESHVKIYYLDQYSITNNQVFLPRYTALEYTPVPPLPHISSDRFTPPVIPFFITQISFRYPFPQSFQILDEDGKQLYRAEIDYQQRANVPNIQVDGDFIIQMQTPHPTADIRAQFFGLNTWRWAVSYYWPEVSIVDGVRKNFGR